MLYLPYIQQRDQWFIFPPLSVGGHLGIILILYLSGYIAYYYGWPMIFYASGKYQKYLLIDIMVTKLDNPSDE